MEEALARSNGELALPQGLVEEDAIVDGTNQGKARRDPKSEKFELNLSFLGQKHNKEAQRRHWWRRRTKIAIALRCPN